MYDTYETADGLHLAVGSLEPQFWAAWYPHGPTDLPDRGDRAQWPALKERLAREFKTRTRAEWEAVFDGSDACVSPVLSMAEAPEHPHNAARGAFVEVGGVRPARARAAPARHAAPGPVPRHQARRPLLLGDRRGAGRQAALTGGAGLRRPHTGCSP